jgi:hypothetical protein
VTHYEMKAFIGIILYLGIVKLRELMDDWTLDGLQLAESHQSSPPWALWVSDHSMVVTSTCTPYRMSITNVIRNSGGMERRLGVEKGSWRTCLVGGQEVIVRLCRS